MKAPLLVDRLVPTLFEDDAVLAVVKPAGIDASQRERASPGLAEIISAIRHEPPTLVPANRLGHYESGVLLLSKDARFTEAFRVRLRGGQVEQSYFAVVTGRMTTASAAIEAQHGASRGRRAGKNTVKAARERRATGKTVLRMIRRAQRRSLIRITTTAPNTHVLRAQLRAAGLRLVGDVVRAPGGTRSSPRDTCLHLSELSVTPRRPGAPRSIRSPLAKDAWTPAMDDRPDVLRAVRAALVRRLPCFTWPDTDSLRLLTPDGEDVRGLAADKLGPVVVLQLSHDSPDLRRWLRPIARWYREVLDVDAVYLKDLRRDRRGRDTAPPPTEPLAGRHTADEIQVRENGLTFQVRPHHGLHPGLFLDHRDNRRRVRELAGGKTVLNLFAYTCSFSVAAAAGGAGTVVSVDLSPTYLDWGRTNFALNELDLSGHEFVRSDAMEYLKYAGRKGRTFDMVIVDPPSFAHGRKRKRSFSVERDLPDLIARAVGVLDPGGVLMVATNLRRMSWKGLLERIDRGAAGRPFRIRAKPRLPLDFAADPQHAKTAFVQWPRPSG